MSIHNQWLAGPQASVIAYAHGDTEEVVLSYEFGGMTDLDLSNLYAIAAREEFDFDRHELLPLDDSSESEIYSLPERFVKLMAQLSTHELEQAVQAWSQTKELACEAASVAPIALQLRELAQTLQAGEGIFLTVE